LQTFDENVSFVLEYFDIEKLVLVYRLVLLLSSLKSSKFPEGNALFASLPSCQAQLEACPAVGWAEGNMFFPVVLLFYVIEKKQD
jgi:hypothetical protein